MDGLCASEKHGVIHPGPGDHGGPKQEDKEGILGSNESSLEHKTQIRRKEHPWSGVI